MNTDYSFFDGKLIFSHTKNTAFPLLLHGQNEILFVLDGTGNIVCEGRKYGFEKGNVFIFKPIEAHRIIPDNKTEYARILFDFEILDYIGNGEKLSLPFKSKIIGEKNKTDIILSEKETEDIKNADISDDSDYIKSLSVCKLLFVLLDLYKNGEGALDSGIQLRNGEILSFVNDNIKEEISLEKTALKFYISKSQLNRNFNKMTGSNLWEYIMAKRVLIADEYVKSGIKKAEAASLAGFGDYSSYYRAKSKMKNI